MESKTSIVYIFWTCRNKEEAKKIVNLLLDKQLVACASIFPVNSIYRWKGKTEESQETKVILKTQSKHFEAIQNYIETNSSYETSEILQVEISRGNPLYLSWVIEETSS